MKFLLFLILTCFTLYSADSLPVLIQKLESSDFDVREETTKTLSNYPAEYASMFLRLRKSAPPETRARLFKAASEIFLKKIVTTYTDWLYMHGHCGFTWANISDDTIRKQGRLIQPDEEYFMLLIYYAVVESTYEDSGAEKELKEGDVIYEIDGKPLEKLWQTGLKVVPNQKLKLKLFRRVAKESGPWLFPEDYYIVKAEISAMWREPRQVDGWRVEAFESAKWKEFFEECNRVDWFIIE